MLLVMEMFPSSIVFFTFFTIIILPPSSNQLQLAPSNGIDNLPSNTTFGSTDTIIDTPSSSQNNDPVSVKAPRRITFSKDQTTDLGPSGTKSGRRDAGPSSDTTEIFAGHSDAPPPSSTPSVTSDGGCEMESHEVHFTSEWVVRLRGPREIVDQVAFENGYKVKKQLPEAVFPNTYVFVKLNHPKRMKRQSAELTQKLSQDPRVDWAQQEVAVERVKRGHPPRPAYGAHTSHSFGSVQASPPSMTRMFYPDPRARGYRPLVVRRQSKFNDELWDYQWYMRNTDNLLTFPSIGLNIEAVWEMGYTGKNVRVVVLDDGLEHNHTDLASNYDSEISWDTNDDDHDPFPSYDIHNTNSHGTKCAGEIAMSANNHKCGVGVSPGVKIGAVRCLDGQVVDSTEAASLGFRLDLVDIYSASWGPPDDGSVVDGPKRLAREVMERGMASGRGGKGVIYVWASGNGGSSGDNCNCDGYASSIYTISIASSNQRGQWPWYGERCASIMAVAYSSGTYSDAKIATTDLHNRCTVDHTGTSAAAPLATGIVALLLEARPELTWRDVQHLIIHTSSFYPLKDNTGWFRNGAGYLYSSKLGFGLLNAKELVTTSLNWTLVPAKSICSHRTMSEIPAAVNAGKELFIRFNSDGCKSSPMNEVSSLEHVQVLISIEYPVRGHLDIYLKSPSGTVSMLLSRRRNDKSKNGFSNWFFTSLHFWGETPSGKWTLMIRDRKGKDLSGRITSVYLILHGTKSIPAHFQTKKMYGEQEVAVKDVLDSIPEYELNEDVYEQNSAPNILLPILNLATHLNWNDYGHALSLVSRNQMINGGDDGERAIMRTSVQWPDDDEEVVKAES